MILTLSFVIIASAYEREWTPKIVPLANQKIVINAHDWKSVPIQCNTGDTLSGKFIITNNGDLFPGDQTKYDNWLLGGIDFYIFDEENYSLWVEGSSSTPLLEHSNLQKLTWRIDIPHDDVWYVIYSNDSIFIIEIEESVAHTGLYNLLILVVALVGTAALLSLTLFMWKKNEMPWQPVPQQFKTYSSVVASSSTGSGSGEEGCSPPESEGRNSSKSS